MLLRRHKSKTEEQKQTPTVKETSEKPVKKKTTK